MMRRCALLSLRRLSSVGIRRTVIARTRVELNSISRWFSALPQLVLHRQILPFVTGIRAPWHRCAALPTLHVRNFSYLKSHHKAFQLLNSGSLVEKSITIEDILNNFKGVQIRDMRIVDTLKRRISLILVRDGAIVVRLEHLGAFISPEKVIIFDSDAPAVRQFVNRLLSALHTRNFEYFELFVLEEMLNEVTQDFEQRLQLLIPIVEKVLQSIGMRTATEEDLMRLVPMKKSLTNFKYTLKEFKQALDDVLSSNEDLNNMYLSRQKQLVQSTIPTDATATADISRTPSGHMEVEMMLENYAKKAQEMSNEIDQLFENIEDVKTGIDLSLDNTRNHLMKLNLQVAITALSFSTGGLVASVFGMNLTNYLENSLYAFPAVVGCIGLLGSGVYLAYIAYYYRSRKRIQVVSRMAVSNTFFDSVNSVDYIRNLFKLSNKEEFRRVLEAAVGRPVSLAEANEVFQEFDENRDSTLDRKELTSALLGNHSANVPQHGQQGSSFSQTKQDASHANQSAQTAIARNE